MQNVIQWVFDIAVLHLFRQNAKSVAPDSTNLCRYRGSDGKMCGFGPFIKDECADSVEGISVDSLLDETNIHNIVPTLRLKFATLIEEEQRACKWFCQSIQYIHDSRSVHQWSYHFHELAARFNLSTASLELFNL